MNLPLTRPSLQRLGVAELSATGGFFQHTGDESCGNCANSPDSCPAKPCCIPADWLGSQGRWPFFLSATTSSWPADIPSCRSSADSSHEGLNPGDTRNERIASLSWPASTQTIEQLTIPKGRKKKNQKRRNEKGELRKIRYWRVKSTSTSN
jgi:hypothetical protein